MSDEAPDPVPVPVTVVVKPAPWFKRLAKLWGFALFFLLVALVFHEVLLPFIFALAIVYILAPAVSWLCKWKIRGRHLPRGLAVVICYVAVIASLTLFFIAFLPRLSNDFARLGREAPGMWERAQNEWTPKAARWLEKHFPSLAGPPPAPPGDGKAPLTELPPPPGTVLTVTPMANGDYAIIVPPSGIELERVDDKHSIIRPQATQEGRLEGILRDRIGRALEGLEGQLTAVVKFGQSVVTGLLAFLAELAIVLLLAAYILIDLEHLHRFARDQVPASYRADYDLILKGIDNGMHGVIRGQMLVCLIDGVLTYIGLLIFQVNYSLLLAALAGVTAIIPIFGIILSAVPIVLVATISGESIDIVPGLIMLMWIAGVHLIDANFISPRIIGRQAKIHPVLVVFALLAGAHTGGIVGAVLAVPVASIIQTLFMFFRNRTRAETGPIIAQ